MGLLEEQFEELRQEGLRRNGYAVVELTNIANGTSLITLREFALPSGWSKQKATVYFLVPIGYPVARPDTFWTDPELQLAGGGIPVNTGSNQMEGVPPNLLWFSWHPSTWNPNRDNLITYAAMIRRRFDELR